MSPRHRAAGLSGAIGRWTARILSASLRGLIVLPLLALFAYAGPAELAHAVGDPQVVASLAFTLLASAIAVGAVVGLGVPLGYLLARRPFRGHALVESVVGLPVVVPHLVAGFALWVLVNPGSVLGRWAAALGLPLFQTIWGVVLVMVYVSVSYTVLASQLAFRSVDPALLETARTLGASPSRAFWTISVPIAGRGIAAGAILSWARAVSEVGGFLILAYPVYPSGPYAGPVTAPASILVYNLYSINDLGAAAAAASLLVLVAFAIFLGLRAVERAGRLPWRGGELLP